METIFVISYAAVVFGYSVRLLAKDAGWIQDAFIGIGWLVGGTLLLKVVFQFSETIEYDTDASRVIVSVFVGLWAINAIVMATTVRYPCDTRPLGFLNLMLAAFSLLMGFYFSAGPVLDSTGTISAAMAMVSFLLAVNAFLVFLMLVPPYPAMDKAVGWWHVVSGTLLVFLWGGHIFGAWSFGFQRVG